MREYISGRTPRGLLHRWTHDVVNFFLIGGWVPEPSVVRKRAKSERHVEGWWLEEGATQGEIQHNIAGREEEEDDDDDGPDAPPAAGGGAGAAGGEGGAR